ncbi:YdeI/OmpD-associated family protein [Hymenobacter ginsengisoli]|uniref:YdeI/OmpD-associated family protein n=1 Tax=Hymenobacter ginsengisoli TaxID=1051626 RepID=A0ABP8Q0A8_9BACT|nr:MULTISPECIES: YdeI/OmpD-associated family protein [unclassified Hymenobacter]MBO2030594.1 YdeI/OmpD-associated family protein [Hymenobacter sp. BT559]
MLTPETSTFWPSSRQHWREWLLAHHAQEQAVWLVYHKKHTGTPSLSWSEAVSEALCFGWIDSQAKPIDGDTYRQLFSRRKPRSGWSRVNKEKIKQLLADGLMMPAGLAAIETAQQNGSWALLDEVDALMVPPDLAQALQASPAADSYFASLSRTDRRNMLQWLVLARRPETRQRRLAEIVTLATQQLKPVQFRGRQK